MTFIHTYIQTIFQQTTRILHFFLQFKKKKKESKDKKRKKEEKNYVDWNTVGGKHYKIKNSRTRQKSISFLFPDFFSLTLSNSLKDITTTFCNISVRTVF